MKSVCFMVVCYNRYEMTKKCISDLFELSTHVDAEIWLFDDGTDNTGLLLKNEFPNLELINGNGDNFWNRSNVKLYNEIKKESKNFSYYCLINDDLELEMSKLSFFFSNLDDLNEEILYYGQVVDDSGNIIYGLRTNLGIWVKDSLEHKGLLFLNGNFLLISDHLVRKLGFLDPHYVHVFGDTEFGLRALKQNVRIMALPFFVGKSLLNQEKLNWLKSGNMYDRFKKSKSHLYFNHKDFFSLNYEYRGIFIACLISLKFHLRLIFGKYVR